MCVCLCVRWLVCWLVGWPTCVCVCGVCLLGLAGLFRCVVVHVIVCCFFVCLFDRVVCVWLFGCVLVFVACWCV